MLIVLAGVVIVWLVMRKNSIVLEFKGENMGFVGIKIANTDFSAAIAKIVRKYIDC